MPFFKKHSPTSPYDIINVVREKLKEMEQNGNSYFYTAIPEAEYERVHSWCNRNGISILASHITDGRITYLFRKAR